MGFNSGFKGLIHKVSLHDGEIGMLCKTTPLQVWTVPSSSRKLRLP